MRFQVLISTMNNKFHNRAIELSSPYLVINQLTNDCKPINDKNTIHTFTTGLSKSRNHALKCSEAEICLISDDDLYYLPEFADKITSVFQKYPDVDIITFKIINPDYTDHKKYSRKPFYHNLRTLMKVSSVEIALRRNIINNSLMFDEDFGLGTSLPTGEETIFLTDALKQGKKILYYPLEIVIHPQESSGSNYKIPNLAKAKGAVIYRIFPKMTYILCFIFAVKHYQKSEYTLYKFINEMFSGIKYYKSIKNAT